MVEHDQPVAVEAADLERGFRALAFFGGHWADDLRETMELELAGLPAIDDVERAASFASARVSVRVTAPLICWLPWIRECRSWRGRMTVDLGAVTRTDTRALRSLLIVEAAIPGLPAQLRLAEVELIQG